MYRVEIMNTRRDTHQEHICEEEPYFERNVITGVPLRIISFTPQDYKHTQIVLGDSDRVSIYKI